MSRRVSAIQRAITHTERMIPAAERDQIFEAFHRARGAQGYDGHGIGLAVCRKIVERHGGTITAHSAPGAGATFVVVLPSSEPRPEPYLAPSAEVPQDARQLQGVA